MEIRAFQKNDTDEIIQLVLHCQNDGSRPAVSVDNQPELLRIEAFYLADGGNFWVAIENEKVAGSIGLMNMGNGIGILKKFFVYEPYRGAPHHLGQQLFEVLLTFARQQGFSQILLDTPSNTVRAHQFYETAGFQKIEETDLPILYDHPYKDSDFFRLLLG